MSRARRSGFTLVELLVAVALTGLAALLAARTFGAVTGAAARTAAAREALDRRVNARRWLARAFGSLDLDQVPGGFAGEADRVGFATWLERPEGWLEPGRVELEAGDGVLRARLAGDSIVLASSIASLELDYLLEPGENTRWARRWVSPVSAPLAVRLRLTRSAPAYTTAEVDTLLFLIGERG